MSSKNHNDWIVWQTDVHVMFLADLATSGAHTMYECFLEIAFEAEVNTREDPECLELAKTLCNENPITRAAALDELRDMIYGKRFENNP